jgi:hypothetical protein
MMPLQLRMSSSALTMTAAAPVRIDEGAESRVPHQIGPLMSALGQKRTLRPINPMSALPPKADMVQQDRDARFVPIADILMSTACSLLRWKRPLSGIGPSL